MLTSLNLKKVLGSIVLLMCACLSLAETSCLETRPDQKEVEEKQVIRKQVATLQQSNADVNARFQDLEDDSRKHSGRIEALENKVQQMNQQISSKVDKNNAQLDAKLKEKDDIYHEEFLKLRTELDQVKNDLAAMRDDQKRVAAADAAAQASTAAAAQASAKNPFESAESRFDAKKWKEAILDYEKYRKANPKGKHFATATLKIGQSFQELGLLDDASAFYEEVVAKFPKSKEAAKASSRLKKLKKK
jgi:TolA-binding protein